MFSHFASQFPAYSFIFDAISFRISLSPFSNSGVGSSVSVFALYFLLPILKQIFARLFKGGSAKLLLTDEENMNETGVDIEARLPGKRMQMLALLSGGERAMTAVALVFALLKASPTPFCVMDEVDAALDEANISRLRELLEELSKDTQFVLITHNRNTVQIADLIYGITMGKDTASQTISLKLEEVDHRYSS